MANEYGSAHRRLRQSWAPRVAAGKVDCARCGRPILPGEEWHLDHDDRDRSKYVGPSHARCNLSAQNRERARRAREWAGKPSPRPVAKPPAEPAPFPPGNTVTRWSRHWAGGFDTRCPECRKLGRACADARPEGAAA